MRVEVWSDLVCPWCYIGKRHLERALASFPHRDQVEVTWRSYELQPAAPRDSAPGGPGRLAEKYRIPLEQAQAIQDRVTRAAAAAGLDYRLDRARGANTLGAHRLVHLAAERGLAGAVQERLMSAHFIEGSAIGDPDTLAALAAEAGLDTEEARAVLASDRYLAAVREDEDEARRLGITGVPFFVLDRTYGVSGAQPPEVLLSALEQAWEESHTGAESHSGAGVDLSCSDSEEACEV